MDACRALRYWRDRKKRWRWVAVAYAPQCRSWTSNPPRKHTTWSKSWMTDASVRNITSPPLYLQPVRPYRRTCIRPLPGHTSMGKSIFLYFVFIRISNIVIIIITIIFYFIISSLPHITDSILLILLYVLNITDAVPDNVPYRIYFPSN